MPGIICYDFLAPESEPIMVAKSYHGSDNGLVYRFFSNPISEFTLKYFIPRWLAPNAITCLGFLCVVTAHVLYMAHTWGSSGILDVPRWVYLAFAGLVFAY